MAIIPDPQLASELIKSVPDAAHGFVALIGGYLHAHGDSLQNKAQIVEAAALGKIGTEAGSDIYNQAISLFERIKGREMLVSDLERIPADLGESFILASRYVQDEELRALWASLLASYVIASEVGDYPRSAFVTVLKDLTPLDAKCLEKIYSVNTTFDHSQASILPFMDQDTAKEAGPISELLYAGKSIATVLLPDEVFLCSNDRHPGITKLNNPLRPDISAAVGNISRLGLIELDRYIDGGSDPRRVFHTAFGYEFSKSVFLASQT